MLESGRIQRGYKALFTVTLSAEIAEIPASHRHGAATAPAERKDVEISTHNLMGQVNLYCFINRTPFPQQNIY